MNKVAIVFISYDRPQYLAQCLESFKKQLGTFPECDIYLAQDSCEENKMSDCIKLFKNVFAQGFVLQSTANVGIAYNYYNTSNHLFNNNYDRVIYIEDDMVLSPYFLDTMFKMINKFGDDKRVGVITVAGHYMLNSLENQEKNKSNIDFSQKTWGYSISRKVWFETKYLVEEYLELIKGENYKNRSHKKILKWLEEKGFQPKASSQDYIKECSIINKGYINLTCYPNFIKTIGEVGVHCTPENYKELKFGEEILYEKEIECINNLSEDKFKEILTIEKKTFFK